MCRQVILRQGGDSSSTAGPAAAAAAATAAAAAAAARPSDLPLEDSVLRAASPAAVQQWAVAGSMLPTAVRHLIRV